MLVLVFSGEHIGCPFATQEESGFEDELSAFSFLSFDPIMVAEQFTLMDAVRIFSSLLSGRAEYIINWLTNFLKFSFLNLSV